MSHYAPTPLPRSAPSSMAPHYTAMSPYYGGAAAGGAGLTQSLGNAKHYFNSARNVLYSRYSTNEWEQSNSANYSLSNRERTIAERLRSEAWQAIKATDTQTRNRQHSNTRRLGERVYDITFWKQELNGEIHAMENEIDNLKEHKRVLEKAYFDTRGPMAIAEECLLQREKRQGIDQVHDDVERHLSREVETIRRCQDKMKQLLERTSIQLKVNRASQHACERDSKDKNHAQNLDDRMQQLRNSSGAIGFQPGIENVDTTITIPMSWVQFTQENIARSQHEREISEKLRGEIDAVLRACANGMWSQFNTVNNAFGTRIQQANDAKSKLQAHLSRTNNEIRDMGRAIELLRKAIRDKEAPMKVAQTRLDERTQRINVEACNDPVMKGLQREVTEIRDSVRTLRDKLRQAENSLVRLLKTRRTLESDISVKENSLAIDGKYCMGMRKSMPMDPKIGPIFNMPLVSY